MGENVHGERGSAHIRLAADVTRLGILRRQRLVGLLVAGEVGARGKLFVTLCTLVLVGARCTATTGGHIGQRTFGSSVVEIDGLLGEGFQHVWLSFDAVNNRRIKGQI